MLEILYLPLKFNCIIMRNSSLSVLISFGLLITLTSFSKLENDAVRNRENTPGTVTFTVRTVAAGGNYSPKHVLAIWVEKDGAFVKTRKAMANQRKQYLYTWKAVSNYNVVDAITGSTLTSHQTHTVQWDCTDLDGNIVSDGTYKIRIEFTDKHAQGPLFGIEFIKGTEAISLNPPDEQYFKDIEFSYEPDEVLLADFTSDVQETCMNESVVFTDNSTGATSWDWDFGEGANPATANTQGPHSVSYNATGSKTVSLTIDQGITQTKTDYITVMPDAIAGFTWTQQSRTITFANTSQNAVSYNWDFGDGTTASEENPVHTYAEDGSYDVSLTAVSDACANDVFMEEIVINTVGISEPGSGTLINVYPNPGNGIFYISPTNDLLNSTIRIFDLKGQILFDVFMDRVVAGNSIKMGSDQLEHGLYFLEIKTQYKTWQQKLLVR